jgi:Zn-dependent metalloprotease
MEQTLAFRSLLYVGVAALFVTNIVFEASAQCDRAKQQRAIAALGGVSIEFDRNHVPAWIRGQIGERTSEDPVESALAVLKANADVFCALADDGFVFSGQVAKEDKLGQTAVRINQTYRGLDVFPRQLIVNMTRHSVIIINGQFKPEINVPTKAVVNGQEASRSALEYVAAIGGTDATVTKIGALMVFVGDDDTASLTYPVTVGYRSKPGGAYGNLPQSDDFFVDAIAGAVVGDNPRFKY